MEKAKAALYPIFKAKLTFIGSIVVFEGAFALYNVVADMSSVVIRRATPGVGGTGIYLG